MTADVISIDRGTGKETIKAIFWCCCITEIIRVPYGRNVAACPRCETLQMFERADEDELDTTA
jgi:hypothetical protein